MRIKPDAPMYYKPQSLHTPCTGITFDMVFPMCPFRKSKQYLRDNRKREEKKSFRSFKTTTTMCAPSARTHTRARTQSTPTQHTHTAHNTHTREYKQLREMVMRTSSRPETVSIESISGSGVMQFFGFNLVLFLDLFICLLVDVVGIFFVGI